MQLTYAWCALYVALVVLGLLVLTFGQGESAAGLVNSHQAQLAALPQLVALLALALACVVLFAICATLSGCAYPASVQMAKWHCFSLFSCPDVGCPVVGQVSPLCGLKRMPWLVPTCTVENSPSPDEGTSGVQIARRRENVLSSFHSSRPHLWLCLLLLMVCDALLLLSYFDTVP